jgi:hypothetical protein
VLSRRFGGARRRGDATEWPWVSRRRVGVLKVCDEVREMKREVVIEVVSMLVCGQVLCGE